MTTNKSSDDHSINEDEFVIFAELNRDNFDEILQTLRKNFENIQSGRQGDDWIWIPLGDDKIEIDSFYSMQLEVKGKYRHFRVAVQIIQKMDSRWVLQFFSPPKQA